jgi:hypothetical protein
MWVKPALFSGISNSPNSTTMGCRPYSYCDSRRPDICCPIVEMYDGGNNDLSD